MTSRRGQDAYRVRDNKATWKIQEQLGIDDSANLYQTALNLSARSDIASISLVLPDGGVSISTFQILTSLRQSLENKGKSVQMIGTLAPSRGRPW